MRVKREGISRPCHFERGKIKFSKEISGGYALASKSSHNATDHDIFALFCLK